MRSKDAAFLAKIKDGRDHHRLKQNDQLVLVGRNSYTLTLEPLTLMDCERFWLDAISV